MSKYFLIILFIILSLRVLFFALPSFPYDIGDWKAWSIRLVQVGPPNFYSKDYFSDYFPGYLYMLWITGSLFNFFSISINSKTFEIFIKTITTVFDFMTAYFIFKIVSRYNIRWKFFAPILYLLNPAIIFNSSIWGQVDGIFTFFLIASSYFIIEKKEIFKSSLLSSLGILIKPHSIVILPVLLLYAFKNFLRNKFYKSIILGVLVFVALSIPFFPNNPILGIFELAVKSQDVYKYTSLNAFNYWALFGLWRPDNQVLILSYKTWGALFFLISLMLVALPLLKKQVEKKEYYLSSSILIISSFTLLTRMHERYLFPFLGFILIAAIIYRSRFLISVYVLSSLLNFINLWYVYYFYVDINNKQLIDKNLFYNLYTLIDSNYNFFSVLMVLLYLSLLIFYFRPYAKKSYAKLTS